MDNILPFVKYLSRIRPDGEQGYLVQKNGTRITRIGGIYSDFLTDLLQESIFSAQTSLKYAAAIKYATQRTIS